jgi:hypothetical protein
LPKYDPSTAVGGVFRTSDFLVLKKHQSRLVQLKVISQITLKILFQSELRVSDQRSLWSSGHRRKDAI